MVGDLVGGQAVRGADLLRRVVESARHVLVRRFEFAGRMERRERRLLLDGQLIKRKMLAGLGERPPELARPIARRLPRPRVDEIEGIAVEHAAGDADRVKRLARRMQAPELGQRRVVERLHAERYAIDAGGAVAAETRRLDAGRIGFERHLDVGRDAPMPRDGIEHGGDRRRLHQRGRAAAEEDRGDGPARHARGSRRDLRRERAHEARLVDAGVAHMAVEVAIGTFRQAERPMDVDAERRFAFRRLGAASGRGLFGGALTVVPLPDRAAIRLPRPTADENEGRPLQA